MQLITKSPYDFLIEIDCGVRVDRSPLLLTSLQVELSRGTLSAELEDIFTD